MCPCAAQLPLPSLQAEDGPRGPGNVLQNVRMVRMDKEKILTNKKNLLGFKKSTFFSISNYFQLYNGHDPKCLNFFWSSRNFNRFEIFLKVF